MLLDALDHGEEDLERRRLAENRVEARRILRGDAQGARRGRRPARARREARASSRRATRSRRRRAARTPSKIHARIEALDDATKAFAGRRMNRAIARAIEGRRVDAVEKTRRARQGHRGGPRPLMATVRFKGYGEVEVPVGTSLLEAATKAHFPEGSACGGVCACSTCHVYVTQGRRAAQRAGGRRGGHPRQGVRRARRARVSAASRRSSATGIVEVEITRESVEAYENEHPAERGKYTKRATGT